MSLASFAQACYRGRVRASDHFYSELESSARRNRGAPSAAIEYASKSFERLIAPTVGAAVAKELFRWWLERHGASDAPRWEKLAHVASFVLGDYDDAAMDLDREDWEAIRDVLSEAADELDLAVLSELMGALVSHGVLD
jgi:hypothetical protein